MALIMIRCPSARLAVSTGIRLEASRWNSAPEFYAYTRCPICLADHEWSAKDVILLEEAERRAA